MLTEAFETLSAEYGTTVAEARLMFDAVRDPRNRSQILDFFRILQSPLPAQVTVNVNLGKITDVRCSTSLTAMRRWMQDTQEGRG